METVRAPPDVQPAGQGALSLQTVCDAFLHHVPHRVQVGVEFFTAVDGLFVGAHDFGDGQAGLVAKLHELRCGVEGIGHRRNLTGGGHAGFVAVSLHLPAVLDEAAADGVVILALGKHIAVSIPRVEDEAVRVRRHRSGVEPQHVFDGAGGPGNVAGGGNRLSRFRLDISRRGGGGVADKAQQRCAVGAVADAGGRERSAQLHQHLGREAVEIAYERLGGAHRTDGVGGRRADANAEQVNNAYKVCRHVADTTARKGVQRHSETGFIRFPAQGPECRSHLAPISASASAFRVR